MLTKLLRYEFKSTGRVVLPIAAGVLVLNIFTNILSRFVQNTSDRLPLAGVAMALLALASAVSLLCSPSALLLKFSSFTACWASAGT